jgi:hypothetical protein
MVEKRLIDEDAVEQPGTARSGSLFISKLEWAAAISFPWALALVLMASYGGEHVAPHVPLGRVLCAAAILAAVVCAAMCSRGTGSAGASVRPPRIAGVLVLLGMPVVAGIMVSTELGFAIIPASAILLYCVSHALLRMSCSLGEAFVPVVAAWYAVPPFGYYILLEMYAVKAPALLYVSPASGAFAASGADSVVTGCAYGAIVPALVGVGFSLWRRQSAGKKTAVTGDDPPQFA